MINTKETKRKIRKLKKLKKDTRVGTEARRRINKHIRELQEKIDRIYNCDNPEKLELIDKINAIYPHVNDLRKFTVKQLQFHYDKIAKGKTKWYQKYIREEDYLKDLM